MKVRITVEGTAEINQTWQEWTKSNLGFADPVLIAELALAASNCRIVARNEETGEEIEL